MDILIIGIISYLMGSIPFGLILTKVFLKKDIRDIGSGNIGATNVLRAGNKIVGYITLSLDILKAVIPVIFVKIYYTDYLYLASLCAFIGHVFPVWLKFKGGKGVATLIGVLFATHWLFGAIYVAIWLLTAAIFRYSSLAALIATFSIPVYAYFLEQNLQYAISFSIITVILFWRHKSNIYKLFYGKENKIGQHEHK